jgi:hypothetical protein
MDSFATCAHPVRFNQQSLGQELMGLATYTAAPAAHRNRFDAGIFAVALAGICTFLDVYPRQALLPHLRNVYHASEVEVSLTVSATTLAVALAARLNFVAGLQ